MTLKQKIVNWLYSTWLGDLHLRYLIWMDSKAETNVRFLSPKEMATIIKEYSLLSEGVTKVKSKVNSLVSARSAEEYHKTLSELENMIDLSADDNNDHARVQFGNIVRDISVKKGNKDIVTSQDKLNMIHQRIDDYKELHAHQAKRNLLRQLRKAKVENNQELVKQLEQELQDKHGQRH